MTHYSLAKLVSHPWKRSAGHRQRTRPLLTLLTIFAFVAGGLVSTPATAHAANLASAVTFSVNVDDGRVTASGWAVDWGNTSAALDVAFISGSSVLAGARANGPRPELAAYGIPGWHGFTSTFFAASTGTTTICVVVIPAGGGPGQLASCHDVTVPADPLRDDPRGDLMASQDPATGQIAVYGWAFDANDMGRSVWVTLTDNGKIHTGMFASLPSPELEPFGVPGRHAMHTSWLPLTPGPHEICQFVTNIGFGKDALTKCVTVKVSSDPARDNPRVAMETSTVPGQIGQVIVKGWAFDPNNLTENIVALVQVDRSPATRAFWAKDPYPALAAYGVGGNHGFTGAIDLSAGSHTVCVSASNWGLGQEPPFADCRTVVIAATQPSPRAAFTVTQDPATGKVTVSGWAYDPSSPQSPVKIRVGEGVMVETGGYVNQPYPALAAFGVPGDHGFSITGMPYVTGTVSVCVEVEDLPFSGRLVPVECKSFTIVADAARDNARHAFKLTSSPGAITVTGWMFDPNDTSSPVLFDVYQGGGYLARSNVPANLPSPELYPFGVPGNHGLSLTLAAGSGSNQVCLVPKPIGLTAEVGPPWPLLCSAVTVP